MFLSKVVATLKVSVFSALKESVTALLRFEAKNYRQKEQKGLRLSGLEGDLNSKLQQLTSSSRRQWKFKSLRAKTLFKAVLRSPPAEYPRRENSLLAFEKVSISTLKEVLPSKHG